jgi:hypothetical protein
MVQTNTWSNSMPMRASLLVRLAELRPRRRHSVCHSMDWLACNLDDLRRIGLGLTERGCPFRLCELSRCTQIADFELDGHFTAVKSRTLMPSLRLNRGQTVLRQERDVPCFRVSSCRAALKSRTNLRRNFVRDLDTPVRDLGAMRL